MAHRKQILLVEDNEHHVELAQAALTEHRLAHELVVARDGAEALDCLHGRGKFAGQCDSLPAVVLLDLNLPVMDGLEVLRQIRGDARLKNLPVIVLTASIEDQDFVKTTELGVSAYLVKPIAFREFVKSIKKLGLFWGITEEPPEHCAAVAEETHVS